MYPPVSSNMASWKIHENPLSMEVSFGKSAISMVHFPAKVHYQRITPWNSPRGKTPGPLRSWPPFRPKITGTAAPIVPQPLVQHATAQIGQRTQGAAAQLLDEKTEDEGTLDLGPVDFHDFNGKFMGVPYIYL